MFFTLHQNNSGGIMDTEVGAFLVVEAGTSDEAWDIACQHGAYEDTGQDCPCCGSRWHPPFDGGTLPRIYGTPIQEWLEEPDNFWVACYRGDGAVLVRLVYADGTVETYE